MTIGHTPAPGSSLAHSNLGRIPYLRSGGTLGGGTRNAAIGVDWLDHGRGRQCGEYAGAQPRFRCQKPLAHARPPLLAQLASLVSVRSYDARRSKAKRATVKAC